MIKRIALLSLTAMSLSQPALADEEYERNDHEEARRLQQAGAILPLETILQKAQAIHPGRVLEVELETRRSGHQYEIDLLDEAGRVWELKLDAQSGELIKEEMED